MIVSFIRHASTPWNEQGRMQGRRDVALSEHGRAQAGNWRIPADVRVDGGLTSSPLRRAVETAEILSGSPPTAENALVEMDWGAWEGLTLDEIHDRFDGELERAEARGLDFRPPGGESPRDVLERLRPWLARAASSPVPVVAVTHLGVLRVVLAAATGWDMTGKPPVRLQSEAMHRFVVDSHGEVAIERCNVPLVSGPRAPAL
jgi:broad specificity phosphatase PhoE